MHNRTYRAKYLGANQCETAHGPLKRAAETGRWDVARQVGNRGLALLAGRLQGKLNIGDPGDPLEREADHVADEIVRMDAPGAEPASVPRIQRLGPQCNGELRRDAVEGADPRRTEESGAGSGYSVSDNYVSSLGSGRPLDDATRAYMEPRFDYDFSAVRVHTDGRASESARDIDALAFTVGNDVVFRAGQYAPETREGRRLIAHELTHVVQQGKGSPNAIRRFHLPHGADPGHQVDETPYIAPTFNDLLNTIKAIIKDSSIPGGLLGGDPVNMDLFVQKAGGRPASAEIDKKLGTNSTPAVASMLNYRYLFTCRCGFIDMRHFLQLMYVANWTASAFPGVDGNRYATRKGREHELHAESESRFGPEDTPTNALGAFTGGRLAAMPLADGLLREIETTLRRCDPIDFGSLAAASKSAITHHYGDLVSDPSPRKAGDLIPAHQNQTALPDVLGIPECGGRERSFPFMLDSGDPDKKTISGTAFGSGAAGLTGDSEIRDFVTTQRAEIIRSLPAAEKVRLVKRLFKGWVSDGDLDAIERIYNHATDAEKAQIKAALDPRDLSDQGQRARLRGLFS